tara:strand:+ start:159 stop:935 length:777 start_codon:yes stop_codon:yes gene_type:complete
MINIYEYVKQLNVENGTSQRLTCPMCRSYKTFTVTNNMGSLLWNCYKASCDVRGTSRVHLSAEDIRNMKKVSQVVTSFEMPEYITPRKHQIVDWCNKWGLDVDALELQYDVKENRVVFPIKDNGRIVDATGRSILKRLPKWKRYGSSDLPFSFGCGSIAIVVEDCISAGVIGSDVYVGVAVLGTSLLDSHKTFLSQFSTAIIALDPDALPKSFAFAKELRSHVKDVKILRLKDDLKYRKKEDLDNLKLLTPKETQLWN